MIFPQSHVARSIRKGLTLIEILIALTMTLIVLAAMIMAFRFASVQIQMGRSVMEMANRLRTAEEFLRSDLQNLTIDARVHTESTIPKGYLEYIEGPVRDRLNAGSANSYLGDVDDILALTTASQGRPFRGIILNTSGNNNAPILGIDPTVQNAAPTAIESPLAEIVWFTTVNDLDGDPTTVDFSETIRVHRRVMLIRPDLGVLISNLNLAGVNQFFQLNDISARVEADPNNAGALRIVANSLTDLAVRRNRFCHLPGAFPNRMDRVLLDVRRRAQIGIDGNLEPSFEDVMLTDVAAFDIRVFSPDAGVIVDTTDPISRVVVEPGDVGFGSLPPTLGIGAYTDLAHRGGLNTWFGNVPSVRSQLGGDGIDNDGDGTIDNNDNDIAWDSWTPEYESNGIDEDRDLFGFVDADGNGIIDQGVNGLDDGGSAAPDDELERETTPPYPFPIRGIQVRLRLIEKGTKQVRQTSVIHSYVPE